MKNGKHSSNRTSRNGAGAASDKRSWRMLNKDGTANLRRPPGHKFQFHDQYHSLLRMSWPQFMGAIIGAYVGVNAIFAFAYILAGPAALSGIKTGTAWEQFAGSFYFSVQTLATIGYGQIVPSNTAANVIVILEAFTGMLTLALVTGLLFARFSRPTARVVFSDVAVLNAHDGAPALILRIANERFNQIVEAHVRVVLLKDEVTSEGESYRNFYDLKLERQSTPVFGMTWTVVHYIDESSPLHGMTHDDIAKAETEIIVSVMGTDETLSQTIHARSSYSPQEILWNMRFVDILSRKDGKLDVNMARFHHIEPATKVVSDRV